MVTHVQRAMEEWEHWKRKGLRSLERMGDYVGYVLTIMDMRFVNVHLDYAIYR